MMTKIEFMLPRQKVICSLLVCFALILAGCAGSGRGGTVNFATEGPDLFVQGEYKGKVLEGSIEREVLIGLGKMQIKSVDGEMICQANFNSPPQPNLRIRGIMLCDGLSPLGVTINPLGPDQGLGIARQAADDDLMVFFFHPSQEEAKWRFPQIKEQIERARNHKK